MTPASEIRLLAVDVDGTLAARGDEVTPRTRQALARAQEAGIQVAIATGRRYRTTMRVVESLGLPVDTVCLGGALVKDGTGATLHSEHFDASDFATLHQLARDHGQAIVCHRDSASQGGADFVVDAQMEWNEHTRLYWEQNDSWGGRADGFGLELCPDALVVGSFGREPDLRTLQVAIERAQPGSFQPSLVPSHFPSGWYLELTPRGVSKWTGLRALASKGEIPPEAICAVGDQVNDLPMLREAGMAVAMGNAVDAVKEQAHWVTAACDADGIVAVVDRILGN